MEINNALFKKIGLNLKKVDPEYGIKLDRFLHPEHLHDLHFSKGDKQRTRLGHDICKAYLSRFPKEEVLREERRLAKSINAKPLNPFAKEK